MSNVKFYYSADFKVANLEVLIGTNNSIIGTGSFIGKPKKVARLTICSILDKENNTLSFGVSRCSAKDNFVKKVGQELAFERAISNPYKVINLSTDDKISEISNAACEEIVREVFTMKYPLSLTK